MQPRVDRNALRFNQASIILLTVVAFVLGDGPGRWLVFGVAAVMLLGTACEPLSLFKLAYRHAAVRAGLLRPQVAVEDPAHPTASPRAWAARSSCWRSQPWRPA